MLIKVSRNYTPTITLTPVAFFSVAMQVGLHMQNTAHDKSTRLSSAVHL